MDKAFKRLHYPCLLSGAPGEVLGLKPQMTKVGIPVISVQITTVAKSSRANGYPLNGV